ncbi:MAG: hypothetical protein ABIQ46_14150 [Alteraurantiacibacter sp.]
MNISKLNLLVAVAATLAGCTSVHAQEAAPGTASSAGTVTAAEAQHPDISGIWEIYPDPFAGEENTFLELPVPGDGPRLREPYASDWARLRAERDALLLAGTPRVDPSTLCTPEGMPMIMGAIFPLEILQTPGRVTVLAEYLTQTRRVPLDRPLPASEDINPNFYGYSSGRWEGDTLVIRTVGVAANSLFFEIPFSAEMTITERIRVTGVDLMENVITIEDPVTLLEPYTFTYGYRRNPEYEMQEYFCEREDPLFRVNTDGTVEMRTDDVSE